MSDVPTEAYSQEIADPDRTVIFIGETGAGKSTCANSLAGAELFQASESSASATKDVKAKIAKLEWEEKEYTLKIVDTIGIGDTDLSHEEVLTRLAVACHESKEGINAVFFVVGKRFTRAQADAFDVLWQILFGPKVLKYTTVVRTHFRSFRDPKAVEEDISKLRKQEGPPKRILSCVGDRFLYVDNNEDRANALEESGSLMLKYLVLKCKDVFRPPIMDDVKKNISEHVEEQRRLAHREEELEKQLKEAADAQAAQAEAIKAMQQKADKSQDEMKELLRRMEEQSKAKDERLEMERRIAEVEKAKLESELRVSKEMQELYEKQVEQAKQIGYAEGATKHQRSCLVM
ncbi:uncharacterized protein [Oscarella lobularis]|uniref:uncharacterized protein n=1 Tax=Oscarella lobularis TaxID=121494 RepID=UPI003313AC8F